MSEQSQGQAGKWTDQQVAAAARCGEIETAAGSATDARAACRGGAGMPVSRCGQSGHVLGHAQ